MPYYEPVVLERRDLGALTLARWHAPDLARAVRPGQALLARCAPPDSDDPLLRRTLFPAGADVRAGVVEVLLAPEERGLAWLAAQPPGARLDVYGPVGNGFRLAESTHNLLLAGAGSAVPGLLFLARVAVVRAVAVVLLVAASGADVLPPPFLLPSDVEYVTSVAGEADLLALLATIQPGGPMPSQGPLGWADQFCLGLKAPLLPPIVEMVRAGTLRWERVFAQVALPGAMPCGVGTCQGCLVETRDGVRPGCREGPVFDLGDLRL
ncbi:MAG: iron-sulfur cluster-binding protein [Chloroflexaceae bacterium]